MEDPLLFIQQSCPNLNSAMENWIKAQPLCLKSRISMYGR